MWPIKITIWNCNMLQHTMSGKKHFLYATISVNVHMPFLLILLVALLIRDLKMSPLISPTICHIDWQLSPWPTNRQQTSFHRAIPSSILVQFASEGCVRLIRFNRVCLLRRSPESVSGWQALEMVMEKNITRQDNTVSVTFPSALTVLCRILAYFNNYRSKRI